MRFVFLFLSLLVFAPASWGVEITGFTSAVKEDGEHVALRLSEKVHGNVFRVENPPPRVVVDLPHAVWRGGATLPADYQGTLIKGVRFADHGDTSRIVFDLATDVAIRHIELTHPFASRSYWLEFDLVGQVPAAHSEQNEKDDSIFDAAEDSNDVIDRRARDRHRKAIQESDKHPQLPMIVIDAGHGGQDPGTSGYNGTQEKRVTLRYAHALKDLLLKTGRYRVFLTREDDRYLFLRDRVKRAREAKGDLFISLHADSASDRTATGLSVYTISETASDKESAALAAKENKADVIGGMDLSDASKDVADILIDLTQRETRAKSAQFADLAVRSLGQEVTLLSHTHRFAGFAVLKAPDIPSVLVEIGFLTNPREERLINSNAHEAKVVHGLVKAIDSYFGKHKR